MRVRLDRKLIGSARDLFVDLETRTFSLVELQDCWNLHEKHLDFDSKCLKTLLRCNNKNIDIKIPEKYQNLKQDLKLYCSNEHIQWSSFMNREDYINFINSIIDELAILCKDLVFSYYENVYQKISWLTQQLRPAKINERKIKEYIKNEENTDHLESFCAKENGFTDKIVYDRLKSRTGRFVVESGPHILHLKKEYRNIIESRYDGGKIISLDYAALEVRIALMLLGIAVDDNDLYSFLEKKYFPGKGREWVKKSIIVNLYSDHNNSNHEINQIFDKAKLENKLRKIITNNSITTLFLRKIEYKNIINDFCQSSGVDIATLGFYQIVRYIQENQLKIQPLFILHDALILDVHPNELSKLIILCNIGSKFENIPHTFPLKPQEIL